MGHLIIIDPIEAGIRAAVQQDRVKGTSQLVFGSREELEAWREKEKLRQLAEIETQHAILRSILPGSPKQKGAISAKRQNPNSHRLARAERKQRWRALMVGNPA